MDTNKTTNPFLFASILTLVVSLLLSLTATSLRGRIAANIELDKKKNIIKIIGVDISKMTAEDIVYKYKTTIKEFIIDSKGNERLDLSISDLQVTKNKTLGSFIYSYNDELFYPLYKSSNVIIIPISGKGLWSTLYGYFALDINDMNTVKGITFYQHGETPGLGAEVDKPWFQNNFINKKIFDENNNLVSVSVSKGKSGNNMHAVDGISGATVTSNGVTKFLKMTLNNYKPYFNKSRE